MKCPNCQTDNPEAARFCMTCGAGLQASAQPAIPAASLVVDSVQPPSMDVMPIKPVAEPERKVVTILFCDVSESTELASRMDPEEWTEIMNTAFELLTSPVTHYEGTVARLMGDAILAFFGAPYAHEDDPQRAILAGLEILQNIRNFRQEITGPLGLNFQVRIGINTGVVVVGDVGSIQLMEYTAMGDAVNLAARMEQTAQPGTLRISDETYRLVAPLFESEPLGPIQIKGKNDPVLAYRVIRQKPGAVLSRGIQGLYAPLIGREREFGELQDSISRLLSQGQGGHVSIIGEAGLGKTRLVVELREDTARRVNLILQSVDMRSHAELQRPSIVWTEGRSLSYETSTPYAPFISLLRSLFNLSSIADSSSTYTALKEQVAAIIPSKSNEVAPFLASMLGIQPDGEDLHRIQYLEPPQIREKVFSAITSIFTALTRMSDGVSTPVVVVLDDLHWVDPTSLELLRSILQISSAYPIVVITLFRPNRHDPSWELHLSRLQESSPPYKVISLDPLNLDESRMLVASLLEIEEFPERIRNLILEKSEGNPFYVEEVIRSLIDNHLVVQDNHHWRAVQEIETIDVPGNLAGVITSRLDRLDPATKRVAQAASVIGRDFSTTLLSVVLEHQGDLSRSLRELNQREIIREKGSALQQVYTFKHALTQETVYNSILRRKKREYHRKIAQALHQVEPEGVNAIARHFLAAGESQQALPFLLESGERAARAYSTLEARQYYEQALNILADYPDIQLSRRAYEGLGSALTFSNDPNAAVETFQAMHRLAQQAGDIPMQISALNKMSDVIGTRLGEFPKADSYLVTAERLARQVNDLPGLSELYWIRCGICTTTGDFDTAVKYLDESIQIGRKLNIKEQMTHGLAHIACTLALMASFEEAAQAAREAYDLSIELGDKVDIAQVNVMAWPNIYAYQGDLDQAVGIAKEGVNLSQEIGVSFLESIGSSFLGMIEESRGEYDQAAAHYHGALKSGLDSQVPWLEVMAQGGLGAVYLEISDELANRANQLHAQALAAMEHPAAMLGGGTAWVDVGYCILKKGLFDRAVELFEKGLSMPTPMIVLNKPRFLIGMAEAALAQQQIEQAASLLQDAKQYAQENRLGYYEPFITDLTGRIGLAKKQWNQAKEDLEACLQTAGQRRLRPLVLKTCLRLAEVYAGLGLREDAHASLIQAHHTGDSICELFTDAGHRRLYEDRLHGMFEAAHHQMQVIR